MTYLYTFVTQTPVSICGITITLENFLMLPPNHLPPVSPPKSLDFFHHKVAFPFLELHVNGIMQYSTITLLCKISVI